MKPATLSELKKELISLEDKQLMEICLRIAKFKKENKELLSYLLFDAHDEHGYRTQVKEEMDGLFAEMPKQPLYQAGKALRKVLRTVNKRIRFSGAKQTEVELLLHFLHHVKHSGLKIHSSVALSKLYETQAKKINKAIGTLHEDLQYDYLLEFKNVS